MPGWPLLRAALIGVFATGAPGLLELRYVSMIQEQKFLRSWCPLQNPHGPHTITGRRKAAFRRPAGVCCRCRFFLEQIGPYLSPACARTDLNSGSLQQQQQQRESFRWRVKTAGRGGCSDYNNTLLRRGGDDDKTFKR